MPRNNNQYQFKSDDANMLSDNNIKSYGDDSLSEEDSGVAQQTSEASNETSLVITISIIVLLGLVFVAASIYGYVKKKPNSSIRRNSTDSSNNSAEALQTRLEVAMQDNDEAGNRDAKIRGVITEVILNSSEEKIAAIVNAFNNNHSYRDRPELIKDALKAAIGQYSETTMKIWITNLFDKAKQADFDIVSSLASASELWAQVEELFPNRMTHMTHDAITIANGSIKGQALDVEASVKDLMDTELLNILETGKQRAIEAAMVEETSEATREAINSVKDSVQQKYNQESLQSLVEKCKQALKLPGDEKK